MPKFDGKGPQGMGLGTGKGFGPCFGFGPGHMCRHNRGLGRYFRCGWPEDKESQKEILADYKKALEEELEDIQKEEVDLA